MNKENEIEELTPEEHYLHYLRNLARFSYEDMKLVWEASKRHSRECTEDYDC